MAYKNKTGPGKMYFLRDHWARRQRQDAHIRVIRSYTVAEVELQVYSTSERDMVSKLFGDGEQNPYTDVWSIKV